MRGSPHPLNSHYGETPYLRYGGRGNHCGDWEIHYGERGNHYGERGNHYVRCAWSEIDPVGKENASWRGSQI